MSDYQDRPWLRLYQPGKQADIKPSCGDALTMWQEGAGAAGTGAGQAPVAQAVEGGAHGRRRLAEDAEQHVVGHRRDATNPTNPC